MLHKERLALLVGKRHPLTAKAAVTAAEVASIPLALLDTSFSTRRIVDRYFTSRRLRPTVAVEANSLLALMQIVRHTDLSTILPENIADAEFATVRFRPELELRHAALLQRRGAYQSAAVRAFIAIADEVTSAFADGRQRNANRQSRPPQKLAAGE
jgi:LysR family cyn operon transcriptional activator